jgi:hypothetical protein
VHGIFTKLPPGKVLAEVRKGISTKLATMRSRQESLKLHPMLAMTSIRSYTLNYEIQMAADTLSSIDLKTVARLGKCAC